MFFAPPVDWLEPLDPGPLEFWFVVLLRPRMVMLLPFTGSYVSCGLVSSVWGQEEVLRSKYPWKVRGYFLLVSARQLEYEHSFVIKGTRVKIYWFTLTLV